MGAAAAALPYMAAAGTAMQVIGALRGGEQTAQVSEYNAGIAQQQANYARQSASANAESQSIRAKKVLGRMRASAGASGVSGFEDVLAESAATAELDRLSILHGGELKAMGYEQTAELDRRRASYSREEGWGKAGSALLMGAASAFGSGAFSGLFGGGASTGGTMMGISSGASSSGIRGSINW